MKFLNDTVQLNMTNFVKTNRRNTMTQKTGLLFCILFETKIQRIIEHYLENPIYVIKVGTLS